MSSFNREEVDAVWKGQKNKGGRMKPTRPTTISMSLKGSREQRGMHGRALFPILQSVRSVKMQKKSLPFVAFLENIN